MATNGRIGAVVLCGGRSSRMGRDKASLRFGSETLLERMLRLVAEVTPRIVVAAAPGQVVPAGPVVCQDVSAESGPVPALLDAAGHLDTDLVCVVACDMPLLQPSLLSALVDWSAGWDAAVPVVGRRVPTCAVYARGALLAARAQLGDARNKSLLAVLELMRVRDVGEELLRSVDPTLASFTPCNTPEEYAKALEKVRSEK